MRPKMYIANMVQSCAPENVQHSQDDKFLNSEKIYSVSGIPTSQAESNMFMQNPREYLTEDKFAEVLKKLPPLGLKLDKAKFFMDSNQEKKSHKQRGNLATQIGHSDLKSLPEKEARKASKIVTFLLKIGSWQRVSRNEEDVVAKCYFSKRRFVWEILENGLKKKIEIQWEYILSMRVVIIEYQPGILEVELNQPPMFFGETDPEPKKHSRWKHIADFTDGQATICRKHFLKFPPGAFDKHLKKLLRFEPRFLQMCQSTFPRLQNPYFHSDLHHVGENISFECFGNGPETNSFQQSPYSRDFNNTLSFGCNGNDPEMNSLQESPYSKDLNYVDTTASFDCYGNGPQMNTFYHLHYSNDSMSLPSIQAQQEYQTVCSQPSFPSDHFSPASVMDLSLPVDKPILNNGAESTLSMELWGQQLNNYADVKQENMMIQGQFSTTSPRMSLESPTISHQDKDLVLNLNDPCDRQFLMLIYNNNQLPNYSNMEDLSAEVADPCYSKDYGHQTVANENSSGQFHPQTMSWAAHSDNLPHANFGMEDIAGNQNWLNPGSNFDSEINSSL